MEEIEIKLTFINKSEIVKVIKKLGAVKDDKFVLEDTYFGNSGASMSNTNTLVRIRKKDGCATLTCKGKCRDEGGVWHRKELSTEIENSDKVADIIELMGYSKIKSNRSEREIWNLGEVELVFIKFTYPAEVSLLEVEGSTSKKVRSVVDKLGELVTPVGESIFEVFDNCNR